MKLLDLTFNEPRTAEFKVEDYRLSLKSGNISYTGVCHNLKMNSMVGSYLDLPGHIAETDDGMDMSNYPLEKLFRRPARVIRLNRVTGAVDAAELAEHCSGYLEHGDALIINALGKKRFDEILERAVYLDKTAVNWIVEQGVALLVSDIYESPALEGVFFRLFEAGIATVCQPVNLSRLPSASRVRVTVLPLPFAGTVQLPCRIVAEWEEH